MAEKTDEKTIEVDKDYAEPILSHNHTVQKGESIVTCRIDIQEPVKKIGQKAPCPGCGMVFDVVEAKA